MQVGKNVSGTAHKYFLLDAWLLLRPLEPQYSLHMHVNVVQWTLSIVEHTCVPIRRQRSGVGERNPSKSILNAAISADLTFLAKIMVSKLQLLMAPLLQLLLLLGGGGVKRVYFELSMSTTPKWYEV